MASGEVELLADLDRPGGWLLLIDRVRQSYVDLDDPTYLDFEYLQAFADILDALRPGSLAVTHIGGGACTFVRYVAATRPGSSQIVLEPDAELTALIRERLPFERGVRVRIRPVDGRQGIAQLADASADVIALDAYLGGRVPGELTTSEFFTEVARVLAPDGVLLANLADEPPLVYLRRVIAAVRPVLPEVMLGADPAVFRGRRYGNVLLAASRAPLPLDAVARAGASAPFRRRTVSGDELRSLLGAARPLTDADPLRSPAPPDVLWKVSDL